MDQFANSKLLRLEATRVCIQRQLEGLQAKDGEEDPESIEEEHQCLEYAGIIAHDLLFEQRLNEAHSVFKQYAAKKSKYLDTACLKDALMEKVHLWSLKPETSKKVLGNTLERIDVDDLVSFSKFVNLRELFMNNLAKEATLELSDLEKALFNLLREHVSPTPIMNMTVGMTARLVP